MSPSYYPDLLVVPLEEMTPGDPSSYPELAGFRLHATTRRRWRQEMQLVMSNSPDQLHGVLQHCAEAIPRLAQLQAALARRHAHSRGRMPTVASVQRRGERSC